MSRSTTLLGGNLGIGGGAGAGGNPVGAAVGVQGFVSSTNYLMTGVGDIMPGDAVNGFGFSLALHVLSQPNATTYILRGTSNIKGCRAQTVVNGFAYTFGNGATMVGTTTSAIAVGDVNKILLLDGWFDAAGKVRIARMGVEVGAGSAIAAYSPEEAGSRHALGSSVGGLSAAPWARVVGALYFTGVPTAPDILAHYNACKAANTMESMGGAGVVNVNRWQAKDNLPNAATWTDDIGGMVLNRTGTLSSVVFTPQWE